MLLRGVIGSVIRSVTNSVIKGVTMNVNKNVTRSDTWSVTRHVTMNVMRSVTNSVTRIVFRKFRVQGLVLATGTASGLDEYPRDSMEKQWSAGFELSCSWDVKRA